MTDIDPKSIVKEKTRPADRRMEAIVTLINKGHPESFVIFRSILTDEEDDPGVRAAVALALGKIGGTNAVNILLENTQIPDPTVRSYVIEALGKTQEERVIPAILSALEDENNHVFASAAEALNSVGPPVVPHLIRLLDEGADDARCVAAWQLGELCGIEALPKLVEMVETPQNVEVQALCIWALGEIGSNHHDVQDVLEALTEARSRETPEIRLRADAALKKIVQQFN